MAKKKSNRTLRTAVSLVGASMVGAAIVEQLRLPPEQRTWQGSVLGIPYDFRLPTPERLRNTVWNKETSKVLVPHAFGMGWSINFYPIVHPKPVE